MFEVVEPGFSCFMYTLPWASMGMRSNIAYVPGGRYFHQDVFPNVCASSAMMPLVSGRYSVPFWYMGMQLNSDHRSSATYWLATVPWTSRSQILRPLTLYASIRMEDDPAEDCFFNQVQVALLVDGGRPGHVVDGEQDSPVPVDDRLGAVVKRTGGRCPSATPRSA